MGAGAGLARLPLFQGWPLVPHMAPGALPGASRVQSQESALSTAWCAPKVATSKALRFRELLAQPELASVYAEGIWV